MERKLESVMHKHDPKEHLDCFVLCLKIISSFLKNQQATFESYLKRKATQSERFAGYSHKTIQMLDSCLNKIAPYVSQLVKSDKELFSSEFKHFIEIIKWTKQQYLR